MPAVGLAAPPRADRPGRSSALRPSQAGGDKAHPAGLRSCEPGDPPLARYAGAGCRRAFQAHRLGHRRRRAHQEAGRQPERVGGARLLFAAGHRSQSPARGSAVDSGGQRRRRHSRQCRALAGGPGGARRGVSLALPPRRRPGIRTASPRRTGAAVLLGAYVHTVAGRRGPVLGPGRAVEPRSPYRRAADRDPPRAGRIARRRQPALLRQGHRLHAQPARRSGCLAHCAIEVRQDHCESAAGLDHFADILAHALERIMAMPNLHSIEQF